MKMTFREAIEVERMGRAAYAGKRWSRLAATPSLPMPYVDSQIESEWSHVQSIVDAAVEIELKHDPRRTERGGRRDLVDPGDATELAL